jgi:hypothetical protein
MEFFTTSLSLNLIFCHILILHTITRNSALKSPQQYQKTRKHVEGEAGPQPVNKYLNGAAG